MRHLLCMLALAGASMAILGCSSESAAPPPAADAKTDLGDPAAMDAGNPETTGSTTE